MKRIAMLLLACLLAGLSCCAQAATYTYERDGRPSVRVENFDGELPDSVREIFAGLLEAGDEAICGTAHMELERVRKDAALRGSAVLAVRRDEKVLLMGAYRENEWSAAIETDSFFNAEDAFTIRTQMDSSRYSDANILMECGRETFELSVHTSGALRISAYVCEADENGIEIQCYPGQFSWLSWQKKTEEGREFYKTERGIVPDRLAAWTYDAFPRKAEEIGAWIAAHPLELDADEGYMSGVNFRERPTGEAESWGIYTAKVKILGSEPGVQSPWYHVQLGDMTGWCSGAYLERAEDNGPFEVYASASAVAHVGRARTQTMLLDASGGGSVATLASGSYVHVLGERDGYLHVIVPRGELTWQTDWDGTYGFVNAEDMAVGISKADATYRGK